MEQTLPGIDLSESCHIAGNVRFPSCGVCLPGPGSPHPSEPHTLLPGIAGLQRQENEAAGLVLTWGWTNGV